MWKISLLFETEKVFPVFFLYFVKNTQINCLFFNRAKQSIILKKSEAKLCWKIGKKIEKANK